LNSFKKLRIKLWEITPSPRRFDWSASILLAPVRAKQERENARLNLTFELTRRVSVRASHRTDGKQDACAPVIELCDSAVKYFQEQLKMRKIRHFGIVFIGHLFDYKNFYLSNFTK
jgi:hypothetical protein